MTNLWKRTSLTGKGSIGTCLTYSAKSQRPVGNRWKKEARIWQTDIPLYETCLDTETEKGQRTVYCEDVQLDWKTMTPAMPDYEKPSRGGIGVAVNREHTPAFRTVVNRLSV